MRRVLLWLACLGLAATGSSAELPEYQVKAAFLYNFAQFVEWPPTVGRDILLCTYGDDPFGEDLDAIGGEPVGTRMMRVQRRVPEHGVDRCQILFVSRQAIDELPALRTRVAGKPVLIVADSPGATRAGAALNMTVMGGRVTFEANRKVAREAGIDLSSRLLRLATEVIQ